VRDAVADGKPIWLCAGERDADTAVALGYVATSTTDGEASAPTAEHADVLRGAQVFVVIDRDKDGLGYARLAKGALAAVGCAVTVMAPPSRFGTRRRLKDVTDLVHAGGHVTDLEELTDDVIASIEAELAVADADRKTRDGRDVFVVLPKTRLFRGLDPQCKSIVWTLEAEHGARGPDTGTSLRRISDLTGISRRLVRQHLDELVELKIVSVVRATQRGRADRYVLHNPSRPQSRPQPRTGDETEEANGATNPT
jgi:hypothetical protein